MLTYTITIGRNYGTSARTELQGTPMSDLDWATFEDEVNEALAYHMIEDEDTLEVHRGTGVWQGVEEESCKLTLLSSDPINVERLKSRLAVIAANNQQDAIALTIGQSELIKP